MKKRCLSFNYTTFFKILQGFLVVLAVFSMILTSLTVKNAWAEGENALTEAQKNTIVDHCDTMRDSLRSLQRVDSRARVYLGRYYETILTSFMTPLNIRLVENNISNNNLMDNQTKFAARRNQFVNDYIAYQQELEDLVNTNCKTEPEKFYQNLLEAREKRATVNRDTVRLRQFADEQKKLVTELQTTLKKEAKSGEAKDGGN